MAQKKIDFFGQFSPVRADDSGAQAIRRLAGIAGQVGDFAFQRGAEIRTAEGRQEGQQAVKRTEEGGFEAPEMRGSFTFKDRAYNEAAVLAYRAEVRRDTKETLNKLFNQHELDPEAFRENAEAYRSGITNGMPDELKYILDEDIKNAISDRATRIDDNVFQLNKSKNIAAVVDMAADLKDDIFNAARSGNEESLSRARIQRKSLMESAINGGLIDPTQAAKEAEQIQEGILVNQEIGKMERIFADRSLTMEEKIFRGTQIVDSKENAIYKDLNPDQRDALNNALQAELNDQLRKEAEFNAQAQKEIALETVNLKMDAAYGRRNPAEIQAEAYRMFRDQEISESEYQGIMNDIANESAKKTQLALLDTKIAQRLSGDESIALSQKEMDSFYDRNVAEEIRQLDPGERSTLMANLAVGLGGVPTGMKRQINNNLQSGDQALIKEAYDVINALDDIRGIEDPVSPQSRAFAEAVIGLSNVMEPEQAIEQAKQLTDPRNKARIEQREAMIKEEKFKDDYQDWTKSAFDSYFKNNVDDVNLGQMSKEYQQVFEAHFKAGMDEDAARAKTEQLMKRNWKYSETSDRMMKYPPEDYYSVQGDASYIKEQLKQEVSKGFYLSEEMEDVFLISDDETGKLASSGNPDYLVMVRTKDGLIQPLIGPNPDDGKIQVVRWSPDKKAQQEKIKSMNADELMEMRRKSMIDRNIVNRKLEFVN